MSLLNYVQTSVKVKPMEVLLPEYSATLRHILASEIGTGLSISYTTLIGGDFDGDAAVQGFADGAVYYKEANETALAISTKTDAKYVYIEYTGFAYSSHTELGLDMSILGYSVLAKKGTERLGILTAGSAIVLTDLNGLLDASTITVQFIQTISETPASSPTGAIRFLVA